MPTKTAGQGGFNQHMEGSPSPSPSGALPPGRARDIFYAAGQDSGVLKILVRAPPQVMR